MNRYLQYITRQYWFRVVLTVLVCTVTVRFGILQSYTWFGVCICLLILCILWQIRLYRTHVKQVLFMIDALENNDNSFHFPEEYGTPESRQINQALNRVGHILYNVKAETAGQVSENWEQLKLKEKDGNKSVLSGVPTSLPSLIKAYRIQDKARNVGFDWEEKEQVWDKVKEEFGELQVELANLDKDKSEAEFGDFLFSVINAGRLYGINPDNALERTNQKFIRRFTYLEEHTLKQGKDLKEMPLEEMDKYWNEAKAKE